jgi:hypothetical protein
MTILTINPQPTQEVLDFAAQRGATTIMVYSYNVQDGVVWACYNEQDICLGKCDATGMEY